MTATINQLIVLYAFILIGWGIGKLYKIPVEKSKILSTLLVNVLMPCKIFESFSKEFTTSYIKYNYLTIFISVAILALMVLFAIPASNRLGKTPYEKRVYKYSVAIGNYGYMGYVLAEAVLGSVGLTNIILFCIPFSIYTYTAGYIILVGKGDGTLKKLLNPITAAIALGIIFGLTEIQMPDAVTTILSSSSSCVGPMSMIFTGLVISSFNLKELLPNARIAAFTLIKLLALPLAVFGICRGLGALFPLPDAVYPSAVIMASMPCGLNTVIFPAIIGEDCKTGAKLVLFTHLISFATLPLWMWILI